MDDRVQMEDPAQLHYFGYLVGYRKTHLPNVVTNLHVTIIFVYESSFIFIIMNHTQLVDIKKMEHQNVLQGGIYS